MSLRCQRYAPGNIPRLPSKIMDAERRLAVRSHLHDSPDLIGISWRGKTLQHNLRG